jgi:hypothetical protein
MNWMPRRSIGETDSRGERLPFRRNPRGFREARKDQTVRRAAVTFGAVRHITALCLLTQRPSKSARVSARSMGPPFGILQLNATNHA